MIKIGCRLTATLLLLGLGTSVGSALDLYLEPDLETAPVATTTLDDPDFSPGGEVLDDEKAELGWRWGEWTSEMTGYVRDAQIGKDLLPVDGAIVFRRGEEGSPVLTTLQANDSIEILDTGAYWEIRFTQPIPVYYLEEAPATEPPPVAAAPREEVPAAEPPPVATSPREASSAAGTPAVESAPAWDDASSRSSSLERSPTPAEANEVISSDRLARNFEGTFVRSPRRFGILPAQHPFALEDIDGNRIAWVNIDEIVLPGSLENYIGREVLIHGTKTWSAKDKAFFIFAKNMRLKAN